MAFIIDKQTLDDLGIFSHNRKLSVFAIFDNTVTKGGSRLLKEMFSNPLDNPDLIRRRSSVIAWFRERDKSFPAASSLFDAAEYYLSVTDERTRLNADDDSFLKSVRKMLMNDSQQEQMEAGISSLVSIFAGLRGFIREMLADNDLCRAFPETAEVGSIVESGEFAPLFAVAGKKKLSSRDKASLDTLLRYDHRQEVRKVLDFLYLADVYMTAARVAAERGFSIAEVLPRDSGILEAWGLYHPALENPVPNDITIGGGDNVVFLTGANMAGKSTFMKTLGIAVFLAHAGFPVPAASMRFSVRDGLFTTINLPDSLSQGYSHFYAEVRRLRKVAQTVQRHPDMVVIFDELFRGTNVKDAFDATVAVTEAFSTIKESIFIISTHIIEAGEELGKRCGHIRYLYLPTEMDGNRPVYSYRLKEGITADRHGMVIIRNEGILDILN